MFFENYWNERWSISDYPAYNQKWIYLVAGSRNLDAIESHGGLWANVGETTKSVEKRLSDMDYARKAAGGDWIVLNKWKVPTWISDTQIHQELRCNKNVIWKNSLNSEEFLFVGDQKNGNQASLIIGEVIIKIMNSENEKMLNSINSDRSSLRKKLEQLSSKKERLDTEKSKNIQTEVTNWRLSAQTERAWKKLIKDEVLKRQDLDFIEEMKGSFIHSYFLGLLFGIIYIIFEPSLLLFLFVFLPATSFVSSFLGFYKLKARWDSLISSLKEKL